MFFFVHYSLTKDVEDTKWEQNTEANGRIPDTEGRIADTEGRIPDTEGRIPDTEGRIPDICIILPTPKLDGKYIF